MNEFIEIIVLQYLLKSGLSVGNHVYAEVPINPPDTYIIIEKTGSSNSNRIRQAMIAVQSVVKRNEVKGGTLLKALKLNAEVISKMELMAQSENIFRCELNSDYNFTNTQTNEYRYQAVFNIYY